MTLRAIHLLTFPDSEREQRSIADVSKLADFGAEYIQVVNPVYDGELPPAREASDRPFTLGPGHYGCWKAHRDAIAQYLTDDIDALLICECDCVFVESLKEIFRRIERALKACEQHDILAFTFGYRHNAQILETLDDVILLSQWIETHCYLLTPKSKPVFTELFTKPWDTADYFYTIYLIDQDHRRIGAFADRPLAVQARGMSLVDHKLKVSEDHYRQITYQP